MAEYVRDYADGIADAEETKSFEESVDKLHKILGEYLKCVGRAAA